MKNNDEIIPIFLLSLPRSGSTLLQRILLTNDSIGSTSEPWILLPILNILNDENVRSTYGHRLSNIAIEDFYLSFHGKKDDYLEEVRNFILSLYAKSTNKRYFLDKTPRYTLIANEIYETFPDAKYIVLWRNPLAIIASSLTTWKGGKWSTSHLKIDLYEGLENLLGFYEKNSSQVFSLRYEEILNDTEKVKKLFSYLGVNYDKENIEKFSHVNLLGRMGDKTGVNKYSKIDNRSEEQWKMVLTSPLRKWWCRRYLKWIGQDRLKTMGYDYNFLLNELTSIPNDYSSFFTDIIRFIYGEINVFFDLNLIKIKIKRIIKRKIVYPYF